jgi:purine-binding chemotaxis protein CheW
MEASLNPNKKAYLSFRLNNEFFAISVFHVLEILERQHITLIPQAPETLKGVINFRGNVLPVIDVRKKLNMPSRHEDQKYVIIVLEIINSDSKTLIGAMVDAVNDVIELAPNSITDLPKFGFSYSIDYVLGMYNTGKGFMMFLDVNRLFADEEIPLS